MHIIINIMIIILVIGSILGYSILLYLTKNVIHHDEGKNKKAYTSFDGILELNEPLPIWWLWLFLLSILFSFIYLILYPGITKGLLKWTSYNDHDKKMIEENSIYDPMYSAFFKHSVEELSTNFKALKIGKNLFINNCSMCHGLDAKGGHGFPSIAADKWLYGGTPNDIKTSITNGRRGKMPGYISVLKNDEDIDNIAYYILSLNDKIEKSSLTEKGKIKFNAICSACHGVNAKGNKFIGAPDLTNHKWIYGSSLDDIKTTIKNGRSGIMPAHKNILTKEQIHILTAYIFALNKIA